MNYITYNSSSGWLMWLSRTIDWSALRRIGSLPLMRAVMFAPVIAYLILFNNYVIEFLEQVSSNIGLLPSESVDLFNVYFLYYGLICVGVASIFYGIFCPPIIARSEDGAAFASSIKTLGAKTFILDYFDDVICKFLSHESTNTETESLNYTDEIRFLTSQLVVEVFKSYAESEQIEKDREASRDKNSDEEWTNFLSRFYTGSGYYNALEIAKCAHEAPKVIWAFSEPYRAVAARQFSSDIAYAKYEIDNISRPIVRFVCASLYALGFSLLLVPSIIIFVRISSALLS